MNANSNQPTGAFGNPWLQLTIGVICMACVANLQYGWTLFVTPIDDKYHWGRTAIQVAFTLFVLVETWLIPVEGYLVDRFGPRYVVIGGAFLVAPPWLTESDQCPAQLMDFLPMPLRPLPFPSLLVASENDPYLPIEIAARLASAWGAQFVDVGRQGHINVASGHGHWPIGEGLLRGFIGRV